MSVLRSVKRTGSWAADLVHPAPLAAVGVLALNDHLLKGSGLLPGAVTGKLSDLAGLFFFPLLCAAVLRGLSRVARGRDIDDRRSLAAAVSIATALGFAAVKLVPAANALVARTWGVMVMDPTDLVALPVVGLAAAWMLRRSAPARDGARTDLRRALDFAAVLAAAVASIATSKAPPPAPPPAPSPPPRPAAVAVAEDPSCAALSIDTCERTATQTLVVVRARSKTGETCRVDVLRAEEASDGGHTGADVLPTNVVVRGDESRTFALTFLRPVASGERSRQLLARAEMRVTASGGASSVDEIELSGGCSAR